MAKVAETIQRETVAIRFAGDSGDGMQLTGSQFTETTTIVGNDIATFRTFGGDYACSDPRWRYPVWLNFSSEDIYTHGDAPDVLVVMNPAAFKANIADLKGDGILIVNIDAFTARNLEKADDPTARR